MTKKNNAAVPEYYPHKLKAKSPNQQTYLDMMLANDITFCAGPAGTGKTRLAIGMACSLLYSGEVDKIVISRPIVEAGEKIGYLPGSTNEKTRPYLQPIFDEILNFMSIATLKIDLEENRLEICPLAVMRGRTFHNSFIILDEAQNASMLQLKMLLTRIGRKSKMVITGDIKQSDRRFRGDCGLKICMDHLNQINKVGVVSLGKDDIHRHPIIGDIIDTLEAIGY